MRCENKFVFENSLYDEVLNKILLSPFIFSEIYYERKINNIYLDSHDYENYYANIKGQQNRIKQRIRWYGNTNHIDSPILEYKIKTGELGKKEYYNVPGFVLDKNYSYSDYLDIVADNLPENRYVQMYNEISEKFPTLYNSYDRRYYISYDNKYRITIDKNLVFTSIGETFTAPFSYVLDDIVVELKYNNEDIDGAQHILQHLNFRLTRNSKYVIGIRALYFNDINY